MARRIGTIAIDVTERRRPQEALPECEREFRNVLENSLDMIYRLNLETGTYDYVSPASAQVIGYSPDELIALGVERARSLAHPDDIQRLDDNVIQLLTQAPEQGMPPGIEYRFNHKERGYRWVSDNRSVLCDERGVPVAVVGNLRDITERKQAEEALKESEEFSSSLLSNSPNPVLVVNPDTSIGYLNPAMEKLTGFSSAELVGIKAPYPWWTEETMNKTSMDFEDALCKGARRLEELFQKKSGERFWAEVTSSPIRSNGEFKYYVSNWVDVTERKKAEEELAKYRQHLEELVEERTAELKDINEQLQREIVERKRAEAELRIKDWAIASSINAIVMADLEGNLIYVNATFLKMWGYDSSEETIGRPAVEFWQDRKQAARVVRTLLRKGIWQGELVALRADGSTFDGHVVASLVEDDEGEPICLMASMIDMTERKQMEEALRTREEYFESLIENSSDVIVVLNGDGTVRDGSPAIARVMGYEPEEVLGTNTLTFVHPDDLSNAAEAFAQLAQNPGTIERREVRFRHKDGSWRYIEAIGQNLLHDPAVRGIVANFRDITERKKAEEKLEELYQREKELRRELEAEMKRRAEFTRALAHELKTPLTPVVMSSQLLASELKDETLLRVARNISRGAANLNSRIDELLDLARGEMGMLQLKLEQVDALQLLQEVIEDVALVPSSRGQSLISKLPSSLPPVWCDRVRLRQIVLNLLNNAFKFTPDGGEITLRARQEDAGLIVKVRDSGPGIAKQEQQRLFEPYHRVDSDRERLSGLGLGLALCKTLVELHKGRIWVESHAGKGSTFGFSLPLEGPGE